MSETKNPLEDVEFPDLPNGWQWASGNTGGGYYTYWFETEYRMGGTLAGKNDRWLGGFSGEVYWDHGGDHYVAIYPIVGISDDPEIAEYPAVRESFDSAQEAFDAVPGLIEDL